MLGAGLSAQASSLGSVSFGATLYVQGDMEIVSRVPASILYDKDLKKVYPLYGTLWAVKKWASARVQESAMFQWMKKRMGRKKSGMQEKMVALMQDIHADLQGANDASVQAECHTYCDAQKTTPTKPQCAAPAKDAKGKPAQTCTCTDPAKKGQKTCPCSVKSADCDAGTAWANHSFIDYCGEYNRTTATCSGGETKEDGLHDSQPMMHSAADQFINFIDAIRAQGAALFAAKATAYTARTYADDKTNAYRLIVETAWRKARLVLCSTSHLPCRFVMELLVWFLC